MTRLRLTPALLRGLAGSIAVLPTGERACGAAMKTFYVSPRGNDTNPGGRDKPFGSIAQARDMVRQINRNMTGDIVVVLGGGMYRIAAAICRRLAVVGMPDFGLCN